MWTTWKALLTDPGCLLSKEKGRDEGGEVRGGAIGVNPVLALPPADMDPGLVQVNPGDSGNVVEAAYPTRGEVKGESRGGGGMEDAV